MHMLLYRGYISVWMKLSNSGTTISTLPSHSHHQDSNYVTKATKSISLKIQISSPPLAYLVTATMTDPEGPRSVRCPHWIRILAWWIQRWWKQLQLWCNGAQFQHTIECSFLSKSSIFQQSSPPVEGLDNRRCSAWPMDSMINIIISVL